MSKFIPIVNLLVKKKLVESKEEALDLVSQKKILADGKIVETASSQVSKSADIQIVSHKKTVSRASGKLAFGLEHFDINVQGFTCADFGSSTGGFTELLLHNGAAKVYAIDTAKGELAYKLRQDQRVVVMEGVNAAKLESLPEPIDFITVDISLVSLLDILPAVKRCLKESGSAIVLIKPQYELEPARVPKGGVVADEALEQEMCEKVKSFAEQLGFKTSEYVKSPVKGKSGGNQEYLLPLEKK